MHRHAFLQTNQKQRPPPIKTSPTPRPIFQQFILPLQVKQTIRRRPKISGGGPINLINPSRQKLRVNIQIRSFNLYQQMRHPLSFKFTRIGNINYKN